MQLLYEGLVCFLDVLRPPDTGICSTHQTYIVGDRRQVNRSMEVHEVFKTIDIKCHVRKSVCQPGLELRQIVS